MNKNYSETILYVTDIFIYVNYIKWKIKRHDFQFTTDTRSLNSLKQTLLFIVLLKIYYIFYNLPLLI